MRFWPYGQVSALRIEVGRLCAAIGSLAPHVLSSRTAALHDPCVGHQPSDSALLLQGNGVDRGLKGGSDMDDSNRQYWNSLSGSRSVASSNVIDTPGKPEPTSRGSDDLHQGSGVLSMMDQVLASDYRLLCAAFLIRNRNQCIVRYLCTSTFYSAGRM
jgi:hypothetical protein